MINIGQYKVQYSHPQKITIHILSNIYTAHTEQRVYKTSKHPRQNKRATTTTGDI